MTGSLAILNGQFIEADQLSIPATDAGFVWGVTVAEQVRTFGGTLFQLDRHLERLFDSIAAVGTEIPYSKADLAGQAKELARLNHAQTDPDDDLSLVVFVTPGSAPAMGSSEPLVGFHTYPLPFHQWAEKYEKGESLVASSVRQIRPENWPPSIKCRSRMHYFLADREVVARSSNSRALLLDGEGYVCEASTANVIAVFGNELVSPTREKILPGISLAFVEELTAKLDLNFQERDMTLAEFTSASEILLTSTPFCVIPVTAIDGHCISSGQPGPIGTQLLRSWMEHVRCDFQEQARKFSTRSS